MVTIVANYISSGVPGRHSGCQDLPGAPLFPHCALPLHGLPLLLCVLRPVWLWGGHWWPGHHAAEAPGSWAVLLLCVSDWGSLSYITVVKRNKLKLNSAQLKVSIPIPIPISIPIPFPIPIPILIPIHIFIPSPIQSPSPEIRLWSGLLEKVNNNKQQQQLS